MPGYVNIRNNLPAALSVNATVNPGLSGDDWGVDSTSAPGGRKWSVCAAD
jgi:hypothetical protein